MNKIISTLQRVIKDWGVTSVILFVLLFPLSLIYIAFRFLQEWEPSDGDI